MKAKILLKEINACREAIEWIGERTIEEAWNECPRGDWMLWFYAKQYPENIKQLTLAKGHCVNTVSHLMKDKRSINAVYAAIAFGEGKITRKELDDAYASATSAYDADAVAYSAAYSAYAAASAAAYAYADAAYAAAAYSADAVAYATSAYAYDAAAYAAYSAYAKKQNQQQTAGICRKFLELK